MLAQKIHEYGLDIFEKKNLAKFLKEHKCPKINENFSICFSREDVEVHCKVCDKKHRIG